MIIISPVGPLSAVILGAREALSAGRTYELVCQAAGSRPPALITWHLDGHQLSNNTVAVRGGRCFVRESNKYQWHVILSVNVIGSIKYFILWVLDT